MCRTNYLLQVQQKIRTSTFFTLTLTLRLSDSFNLFSNCCVDDFIVRDHLLIHDSDRSNSRSGVMFSLKYLPARKTGPQNP
jgi:hypothetical protein